MIWYCRVCTKSRYRTPIIYWTVWCVMIGQVIVRCWVICMTMNSIVMIVGWIMTVGWIWMEVGIIWITVS